MGLEVEMEWTLKSYNTNMDLGDGINPPHNLMSNTDGTGGGDGVDPQKLQHKYGSGDGINPPHNLKSNIDGTGGGDGVDPQKLQHKYGSGDGINPPHNLMSNIDGTGEGDGVDLKRCNTNMDLWSWSQTWNWFLPHNLMWNVHERGAGDGVDPQNVQHKYGSRAGTRDGDDHLWSKVRCRWDWSQRLSEPSNVQH